MASCGLRPVGRDGKLHAENVLFELGKEQVTIGRDKACSIRIKNQTVSRVHAEINVDQNGQYC